MQRGGNEKLKTPYPPKIKFEKKKLNLRSWVRIIFLSEAGARTASHNINFEFCTIKLEGYEPEPHRYFRPKIGAILASKLCGSVTLKFDKN
jgi:hypothetical protein